MKDRLITLLGGAVSVLLVIGLLVPPSSRHAEDVSRPTSADRGEFGLQGLRMWLEENRVRTLSLRRRYGALVTHPTLAGTGNLLVTSLPQPLVASRQEREQLTGWLDQGNHALILVAKNDRPGWVSAAEETGSDPLLEALGFDFEAGQARDQASRQRDAESADLLDWLAKARRQVKTLQRQPATLMPTLTHPVLAEVESVSTYVYSILRNRQWRLSGADQPRLGLALLVDQETGDGALWEIRIGNGGAWVASYPDLFGNITLAAVGNARLFGNIVNFAVAKHGHVIFDDIHFGLTDLYDPETFFRDPRLHSTLFFIGAFWVLYLLGRTNRLAPPREAVRIPQAADFVEATAGLFARRLDPLSVARGLLSHFFNDVRARYKLPENGKPTWGLLTSKMAVGAQDLDALKRFANALERNRKPDLVRLTHLLQNMRKTLA